MGRWACDGPADLDAVRALQNELALEPFGAPAQTGGVPAPATVPAELAFFEQMWTWMQAFPPSGPDQDYQQRFAPLGLLDPASPYADCAPDLAEALAAGADAGKQKMETALTAGGLAPVVHGWTLTFHMFDYNLDHLGPGTIDDPAWTMPDRNASYLARALAARGGLWAIMGMRPPTRRPTPTPTATSSTAVTGTPSGSTRTRRSTRSGPSPCTICPASTSSPTRSAGTPSATAPPACAATVTGPLTIVIQHDQPADTSNWLPAPAAPFRPLMRLYQPHAAILDGTYQIPPIAKATRPQA